MKKTEHPLPEPIDRLGHALARPDRNFRVAPPANYIFWVGAGFSATAGIPLAEGVVDRLLDKRWRPSDPTNLDTKRFSQLSLEDQTLRRRKIREWAQHQQLFGAQPIDNWGELYGRCLHLLPGEVDRQEFIIECIEEGRGRLNMAHLLLGQLIKNQFVNTVITTNFDDLVLRALQLYFVVPSALDPDSTNTLLTNSRFVQVAYLHGRLASYRQRHTGSEVRESIAGFENYLAQALQDHGLVVIGYRGGDETPLVILEKVLRERGTGPGRGLFWISAGDDVSALPVKVRDILLLKDCYWMPGWDADDFMKKLCAWPGIGLGIPNPVEWTKGMEEMLPEEARKLLNQFSPDPSSELRKSATSAISEIKDSPSPGPKWQDSAAEALTSGDAKEAVRILEAAKPDSESSVNALAIWIDALTKDHREKEAVEKAKSMVAMFPNDPNAHEILARAFVNADQRHEAIPEYQRAIDLGGDKSLYYWLGINLNVLKRPEEALSAFTKLSDVASSLPFYQQAGIHSWIGMSLHDLGRHAEAIEEFVKSASINPDDPWNHWFWGQALDALGLHAEAEEKRERHYEILPSERPKKEPTAKKSKTAG